RLEKIYGFYDATDRLAAVNGRGSVTGTPPTSTHCNNIGPEHRRGIYPALQRWFGMPLPEKEYQQHRPADELLCLTADTKPQPLHESAAALGEERAAAARRRISGLTPTARRDQLRQDWARLLGDVEPHGQSQPTEHKKQQLGDVTVERI